MMIPELLAARVTFSIRRALLCALVGGGLMAGAGLMIAAIALYLMTGEAP